jgi:uncharacterized protein YbbC (DUF1343 family)
VLSEGRGTDKPFQVFGHPKLPKNLYSFTPKPNEGAKTSKCFFQQCYGWNLSGTEESILTSLNRKFSLVIFLKLINSFPEKDSFFLKNNFINKLAGNDIFMKQVKQGLSEADIRKSWEPGLQRFMAIRKKIFIVQRFL